MDTYDLAQFSLFANLTADQRGVLAPLFRRETYATGEVLFKQNDKATDLYIIETGEIVLRYRPYDGGLLDIETIKSGGLVGWSAVIGRSEYTSAAICLTPVQAIAIKGRDLRRVMRADKNLRATLTEGMARIVAHRIDHFDTQLDKFFDGEE